MEDRGWPQARHFLLHLSCRGCASPPESGREGRGERKHWNDWCQVLNWPNLSPDLTDMTWLPRSDSYFLMPKRMRVGLKIEIRFSFVIWKTDTNGSYYFFQKIYKHLTKMQQVYLSIHHWTLQGIATLADGKHTGSSCMANLLTCMLASHEELYSVMMSRSYPLEDSDLIALEYSLGTGIF